MSTWLRRLISRLERRWIRDPRERQRHDDHVRRRIIDEAPGRREGAATDRSGPTD